MFHRLIKPDWGRLEIRGKPNPTLVREIQGPDVVGDREYSQDFLEAKNAEGYNIYYFPNHPAQFSGKFINGRDVDVFNVAFVDCDLKDGVYASKEDFLARLPQAFPVPPSMVVDSGNGVHAYWQVEGLDRDLYMQLQLALIQLLKTDESVWTPLQLMRYPGFSNTKDPKNPKPCRVLEEHSTGATYAPEDLLKHLPLLTPANERRMKDHLDRLEGRVVLNLDADVDPSVLPQRFRKLMAQNDYVRKLFEEPVQTKGDRSTADAALAGILDEEDFDRNEIIQVIANGKKAKSRANGLEYAVHTVDYVLNNTDEPAEQSVSEVLATAGGGQLLGDPINGPKMFDCLAWHWRKQECLGIIAGPSVGKTSWSLKVVKDVLVNNPDSTDIAIFYSLEMPRGQIINRWLKLVGDRTDLSDRLYVIGNEDEDGKRRHMGLQDLYRRARRTSKRLGRGLAVVVVDHVAVINPAIDMQVEPSFGAEGLEGRGKLRTLTESQMCQKLKDLAVMLDTFLIVQSQTTKAKAGDGDTPLDKGAAFGTAAFEWYMDYVVTIWQPLVKLHNKTRLRCLSWQYCKIREQAPEDAIKMYEQVALHFDQATGELRYLSAEEDEELHALSREVAELRRLKAKGKDDPRYRTAPIRALRTVLEKHQKAELK